MPGNEPILLYSGSSLGLTLLSWLESPSRSHLLAIHGENMREKVSRSLERDSGVLPRVTEQLQQRGGVLVSLDQSGGSLRVTQSRWPGRDYQPPSKVLVFGPGEKVNELPLDTEEIWLQPTEYALLPADLTAQRQLERLVEDLQHLPGDLRSAMLRTVANHGTADIPREDRPASVTSKARNLVWAWIALAAAVGLVAGGVMGRVWAPQQSLIFPRFHPAPPPPPQSEIVHLLSYLEGQMKKSPNTDVKALYEIHLGPLQDELEPVRNEPVDSRAMLLPGTWMILKLALLKTEPKANKPEKNISWVPDANSNVLLKFNQEHLLSSDLKNAIVAVGCLTTPPARPVDAAACAHVDLTSAAKGLTSLIQFAEPSGSSNR